MTNPFDNQDGIFHVLINDEGQHCIWPTFVKVPAGWEVIHREDTRKACVDYIDEHWVDMRPNSLIKAMDDYEKNRPKESLTKEDLTKKKKKSPNGSKKPSNGAIN